jgi:hypothetical protein
MAGIDGTLTQVGFEQLTGFAASKALQSIPATATLALMQAEGQAVRYRADGSAPTALVGMRLLTTTAPEWTRTDNLSNLRFIQETATAKLNVTYYKG